jgi:type I restriction enzyme S subunit
MKVGGATRQWKKGQLQDLVFFQRGFDITQSQQAAGIYPVISSSGVTSYHNEFKANGPGVVIGRKGTLGSVHFSENDYWPHDTTLWSKDLKGNNPRFVYYYLHTIDFKRFDVGNSNPTLNRNHIHNLSVLIPPLGVQERIANILSAYDDLIENNRRRMTLLEDAARQIYREWFVRLRFPGYEHTRMTNGVPEGWEECRIREFGEVVTGKTPSTKDSDNYGGEIPFIKTPDMHGNVFVTETEMRLTEKGANTQSGKFIPSNALLVSCIGTIGVVSLTSARSQFNQQINAVVPFEDAYRYYCFFAFKELKESMEAIGGGATMGNVNKKKFENLKVPKPSMPLLRDFHEICNPLFQQIQVLSFQNQRLRAARDLLLPRLMSGETTVRT